MTQRGFRTADGQPVNFADIDPVRDWRDHNTSPATLAMLLEDSQKRQGLDFTASQVTKPARQWVIDALCDYWPTTGQAIAAFVGTMKHSQINVAREKMITEVRFTSKRFPWLSGQIDHAAIVGQDDDETLVVDLFDLKTSKWYATTLSVKDVWANHPDYAWQLNACAVMMEEAYPEFYRGVRRPLRVRDLYLEFIPADSSYKNAAEAERMNLPEWQKVIVKVDRRPAEEVYAVYADAKRLRDEALAAGYAPLCEDRWSNRTVQDLRCKFFCAMNLACKDFSLRRGEPHPLATEEELLAASLINQNLLGVIDAHLAGIQMPGRWPASTYEQIMKKDKP